MNVLLVSRHDKFANTDELTECFNFKINRLKTIEKKLWVINIDRLRKINKMEIVPFINREFENMMNNNTNFYLT